MDNEEIELLQPGLVSCLLDDREVRILKISPKKLTVRTADKIDKLGCIKVEFLVFNEEIHEEVSISDYSLIEEREDEFCFT